MLVGTESATKTIEGLNPDVKVTEDRTRLDATNIVDIMKDHDVIPRWGEFSDYELFCVG